ncbi:DUF4859 domain-containing protein [Filimonas effusa]|uniref:DUF4859 domain-containing protein n=1 Tax=Filimonas effusa TaxID=2508721 RepID=A0A4Q1DC96_9BACT|nr:DUF4859 domain-containing protein [Filimonas effusa]RXK86223.1 DUF4859 domain-containing protein [Filimonas effusa]
MQTAYRLRLSALYAAALLLIVLTGYTSCKKNGATETAAIVDTVKSLKIYKPKDMAAMNWNVDTSQFSFKRSKQSDHFILFWSKEYGAMLPSDPGVPDKYKVDIEELLAKAESFYTMNVNKLKFVETGRQLSNLDTYKMMIFLYYEDGWRATGSGYDNMIGALWISPATCHPVGATIAHEVGHCFQYQVSCDLGLTHGFRYGYGGKGGNTFWEQCAQWQAFQSYPEVAFTGHDFSVYTQNYNKHLLHEDYRYSSYFIHYYWTKKHGIDFIGKLWRQSSQPEDAIQAYQRLTNITNEQFNDEIYDASSKMVTWDLDSIRKNGKAFIGTHTYKMTRLSDGSFQPDATFCPQATGYNVIPLNVPASGTTVNATFKGIVNASGYNQVKDPAVAGWRYGYVALLKDGSTAYSAMYKNASGDAAYTVPANCDRLWFVVTGAPKTYSQHAWDDDNSNDDQWPYNVKFQNTNVLGYLDNGGSTEPSDIAFEYQASITHDNVNYANTTVQVDISKLTKAFQLQPDDLIAKIGTDIKFYAVESNGNLNPATTANGYGHWFSAKGDVVNWGSSAVVYSEYDQKKMIFTIGQYPGHVKAGDNYQVKQALVYTLSNGKKVQATFTFKVSIL